MKLLLNVIGAPLFTGFGVANLSHNTAAAIQIGLAVFCFMVFQLMLHDDQP